MHTTDLGKEQRIIMDRNKVLEFFDAAIVTEQVHIVGCGAIGSHVAEMLTRIGFTELHLYDFDSVTSHNITNQMFLESDIGLKKTEAVSNYIKAINPTLTVHMHNEGLADPWILSGHIIMCVDDIEVRKAIVQANKYNPTLKSIVDFRMRLTDAQHYLALKSDHKSVEALWKSMQFTNEQAQEATPVSACNIELSVVYTVKAIVSFGIANWINSIMERPWKKVVLVDLSELSALAM